MHIHTTTIAAQRGLGTAQLSEIELLGEKIQDIAVRDFKQSAIAVGLIRKNIPAFLHGFIQWQLVLVPRIFQKKCTACEECVDICPVQAFTGARFNPSEPRTARFNAHLCSDYSKKRKEKIGEGLCGLCVYICPHGKSGRNE